ncbi:MAG TPA: NAD(P)H-hydrate dehydratase, partial [Phycisphaerae bacterium]|nr:NAD(P)H-hydrate dehydratase [Phycisphaerae bacterium]
MSELLKLAAENLPKLARRPRDGHKGVFGKILVLGGSRRMIGAPALAGQGALRGGAGLVTIATPGPVQLAVAMLCECATTVPLACDTSNRLAQQALSQFSRAIDACDVIVAGCGFAVGTEQQNFIRMIIEQSKPVVLDADGLNNLSQISDWPSL